jgi:hypothetical protein
MESEGFFSNCFFPDWVILIHSSQGMVEIQAGLSWSLMFWLLCQGYSRAPQSLSVLQVTWEWSLIPL